MNRFQKKCFIASALAHLSLLLVLLVGPAFVSHTPPAVDDLPLLEFIPLKTTDELVSGGGDPKANSARPAPQPQPPPPQPQPPVQPARQPEPEPLKPAETQTRAAEKVPDEPSLEPNTKPKKEFNLVPTVRKPTSTSTKSEDADKRAKQIAESRKKAAKQIGQTMAALGNGLSSGTSVELKGPGGGGVPYANFLQSIKTIYANAWNLPEGVTDDEATATVVVTIARDGTVLNRRITRPSGNREVDRSVQQAIDRVKFAVPLPETSNENQRDVSINFNVRARKLML
jgi:TonB family protein